MNPELTSFATRLRELISNRPSAIGHRQFSELALELFSLQFKYNAAYRKICEARDRTSATVPDWKLVPSVPTSAFKEIELTSLSPAERTTIFHSSGTTEQKPSRHFHNAESLSVYEASLWAWFAAQFQSPISGFQLVCLTPPPAQVPHSSLVHMFDAVWQKAGGASVAPTPFCGKAGIDSVWTLDFEATMAALADGSKLEAKTPILVLGTAFSFVHLLDHLVENNLSLQLPLGSRVMETGGYKNRSRTMPKAELHALITERLGVPAENILCEYGMSELSSQAYDSTNGHSKSENQKSEHVFHFPPWAKVQIISPETGHEVADGETGLIRIFDLANVFSVAAIQTEDLGVRRGDGFELVGRAELAEPRGCSLMTA